ncbi:hypothetical protein V8D89_006752 [Ganoderma adspersum]
MSSGSGSYVVNVIDPCGVLVCHCLLALQGTTHQPMDSALSSVKLSMPCIDPSTLSPFVEPLGGLVYTTFELEGEGSLGPS